MWSEVMGRNPIAHPRIIFKIIMENKPIDLSLKYGLSAAEVSKLVSVVYQVGVDDMDWKTSNVWQIILPGEINRTPAEELIEN